MERINPKIGGGRESCTAKVTYSRWDEALDTG
ncbi:hypothetical protein JOD24_001624 [Kroppenstedtia sanguinis]